MIRKAIVLLFALVFAAPSPGGDPCLPAVIGELSGEVFDVAIEGDYAYLAMREKGLAIYDISDPARPQYLGLYRDGYDIRDVAVESGVACLAQAGDGIALVDVSDPAAPVRIGFHRSIGEVIRVTVESGVAYASGSSNGLKLIDVSDPTSPDLIGLYDGVAVRGLELSGATVYVMTAIDGVLAIDVSDPSDPALLGSYDNGENGESLTIGSGGVVFTSYRGFNRGSIDAIDFSDPASPVVLGTYESPFVGVFPLELGVQGDRLYYATEAPGFTTLDVSNPSAISEIDTLVEVGCTRVTTRAGLAVVASEGYGVSLIELTPTPRVIGLAQFPGDSGGLRVRDGLAYVADGLSLNIVDVSDPASPLPLSVYAPAGQRHDSVEVQGSFAYTLEGNFGLRIVDISDPAAPTERGSIELDFLSRSLRVMVEDGIAYVAARFGGLQIIDVANPDAPTRIGELTLGSSADSLRLYEGLVYIAGNHAGLEIVDASDPSAPVLVSRYETPGMQDVFDVWVENDLAYLACWPGGLHIVDVSDPANPVAVGDATLPANRSARIVQVVNGLAMVGGGSVFDVSDPAMPFYVGSVFVGDEVKETVLGEDGLLYAAAFESGLVVLDPFPCVVPADFDGDGLVGSRDLAALLAAWGASEPDLTGDGVVGSADLAALLAAWD